MIDFIIGIPLPLCVIDHILYEGRYVVFLMRQQFGATKPVFVKSPSAYLAEEKALMIEEIIGVFGDKVLAVRVFTSKEDFCPIF